MDCLYTIRDSTPRSNKDNPASKGFIILEGIIVFCPLSLKNESKPCAFGSSRGKIGDFKSPESENDKILGKCFNVNRMYAETIAIIDEN
jgi:hypothetical protein